MEHFVKLIPEDIRSKLDFENMDSHRLHQAVPKQFLLKDLQGLKINKFFEVNHIFTFSFVRHPFDRLVSAYLDKIGKLFFSISVTNFLYHYKSWQHCFWCNFLHRPGQLNGKYTRWKFRYFSPTQMREINFSDFEAPKTATWTIWALSSSEFWIFGIFWHFPVWNFSKNRNSKPTKL